MNFMKVFHEGVCKVEREQRTHLRSGTRTHLEKNTDSQFTWRRCSFLFHFKRRKEKNKKGKKMFDSVCHFADQQHNP